MKKKILPLYFFIASAALLASLISPAAAQNVTSKSAPGSIYAESQTGSAKSAGSLLFGSDGSASSFAPASQTGSFRPDTASTTARPGAKIVILGDSYSTFEGCIPEGYACWYFKGNGGNNVHSADSTWWRILCRQTGSRLLLNSSYSGATISSSGYLKQDYTDRSFVTRAKTDIATEDGSLPRCIEVPDIVLIFGGTNDHWAGSPVGEVLPPDKWKGADLKQCLPSTSYMLGYLREKLPNTRIVMIVNTGLGSEIENGFSKACKLYGAECIFLHDIDKILNHPSLLGMRQIAAQLTPVITRSN